MPTARPEERPQLLVVGDVNDDIVVLPRASAVYGSDTPARIDVLAGGAAANVAAWLAWSGAQVRFAGRVAAADVSRHQQALERHGVEAHLAADPEHPTGRIVVVLDDRGERSMFTDRGANRFLADDDVPAWLLEGVEHVHISGYGLFDERTRTVVRGVLEHVADMGIGWSVDPASSGFLETLGGDRFLALVRGCSAMFPNRAEARLLTGVDDVNGMAERLLTHVPLVGLTLGDQGVLVAHRDGRRVRLPSPAAEAVDTTGAGDAFCGAFLAAWLADADLDGAARRGLAAASACVATHGARPEVAQPTSG